MGSSIGWTFTHVLVTSGNNGDDAGISEGFDGSVDGLRERTAQGHVHNSLSADSLPLDIVDNELHAVQNAGVAAASIGIKDLDGHEFDILRNTESIAADGASNVATVTIFIFVLMEG